MTRFSQWLNDWRWAANMRRARAWRRECSLSQRVSFDKALRPRIKGEPGMIVAYPDAVYHITIDDLVRAMMASAKTQEW